MPFRYRSDSGHFNDTCEFCGERLTGEQVRFCSANCRAKYHYYKDKPRTRTCEVCGELMNLRIGNPRRRRCSLGTGPDADAGPDDPCWDLQQEEAKRKREAEDARDFPICAHCGAEAEYAGRGRHRKYCSDRCRVAAYRARKRTPTSTA